jgi:hypothetical protein
MPFKIGEGTFPGITNEKQRCEVATYIWMCENCPDVPIPSLYGFAFPNGKAVGIPTIVQGYLRAFEVLQLTLLLVYYGYLRGFIHKMGLALQTNYTVLARLPKSLSVWWYREQQYHQGRIHDH